MVTSTEERTCCAACANSAQLAVVCCAWRAVLCFVIVLHITAHKLYPVRVSVLNAITGQDEWHHVAYIPQVTTERGSAGAERSRLRRILVLQRMLYLAFRSFISASHSGVPVPGGEHGTLLAFPRLLLYICDQPEERAVLCFKPGRCNRPCSLCDVLLKDLGTPAELCAGERDALTLVMRQLEVHGHRAQGREKQRRDQLEKNLSINGQPPVLAAIADLEALLPSCCTRYWPWMSCMFWTWGSHGFWSTVLCVYSRACVAALLRFAEALLPRTTRPTVDSWISGDAGRLPAWDLGISSSKTRTQQLSLDESSAMECGSWLFSLLVSWGGKSRRADKIIALLTKGRLVRTQTARMTVMPRPIDFCARCASRAAKPSMATTTAVAQVPMLAMRLMGTAPSPAPRTSLTGGLSGQPSQTLRSTPR